MDTASQSHGEQVFHMYLRKVTAILIYSIVKSVDVYFFDPHPSRAKSRLKCQLPGGFTTTATGKLITRFIVGTLAATILYFENCKRVFNVPMR